MAIHKRNYRREYKIYQGLPLQLKRRAGRNNSRRLMLKLGRVKLHAVNGKDVHHVHRRGEKHPDTWDNKLSNLRVIPKSKNRSIK